MLLGSCGFAATGGAPTANPLENPTETTGGTPTDPANAQVPPDPPETLPLPLETQAILSQRSLYNPPRGDVRLVMVSDLNGAYGSTDYDPEVDRAIALMPYWQPDLVLCSGDMVAGQNSSLSLGEIRAMWGAFDDHVANPLRRYELPYGFTLGNHDASSALGSRGDFIFQQERDLAAEYWNDPAHDSGVEFVDRFEFPFYYTFQHQDIFFLAWDGSSHIIPTDKLVWAEAALASEAAQSAKLRIVLGHLPLYAVAMGRDQPGNVLGNADQLRAMLERQDVHTYISGHHHAYYPGHRGDLQLLHVGNLGSGARALIDGDLVPFKAITVLDIDFTSPNLTRYTTFNMQTLEVVDPQDLPRFLLGHNGRVVRRDVAATELTPAEQRQCENLLGAAGCTP